MTPGFAPGFDDPRDTEAGRQWLDLAGVDPEPEATPAVDLGSLLTRASDLPRPDRAPAGSGGPVPLPWSSTSTVPAGSGTAQSPRDGRRKPSRGGRRTGAQAGPRTRRPGPAPLPTEPGEREQAAREVVLRQLALGPRSRGQLERKLLEREAEPELIARVLDRFEEVDLVDDAAFAEMWVRTRHRGRRLSRTAISRELQQKGVDRDVAEQALEQIDPEDERAAARELVLRKVRGNPVPIADTPEGRVERDKHIRRLVAMLGRRGYGPGISYRAVADVIE